VDSPFHFAFRDPRRLPRPLLRVDEGAAGYGSRPVLAGLRMTLSPGDRLGLLGPNGAGKSTLIKLLAGDLPLLEGREERAADLAVGYFAQHQLDQLHPEHSPLEHLAQLDRQAAEQSLRDYLGGFGFQGDRALEPVAPLSGGEKARLALALLVYRRPNLLLLDEPTNHLDLEMRLALGQALQEFAGAMVIVSHDRHLLRITTDELLLVHGGGVEPFEGSLDDYPAWLQARNRPEPVERPAAQAAPSRKDRKRLEAERRRMLQPMRDQARSLESEVERLTREQTALETRLADPALYAAEAKEALKAALGQKSEVDRALEEAEERWLDALEALEEAAGAARTDGGG
jgi:ATP-binding cassette subfamily F protein 3